MISLRQSSILIVAIVAFAIGTRNAEAITVPDSGTCTSAGICFQIAASSSGSLSNIGVQGTRSTGVAGYSSNSLAEGVFDDGSSGTAGVYGLSDTGVGVFGRSSDMTTPGNGVLGTNYDTNGSAAAISALAGSSSGLAYYGTGGIEVSGSFAQKAGGGSWTAPSDSRIKKDVKAFDQGLTELMSVRAVRLKYNGLGETSDDGREFVGVIAQDLEKIMPSMVSTRMARLHTTDAQKTTIKVVDPSDFTYLSINAVQEQQRVIRLQDKRILALERRENPTVSSLLPRGGVGTAAVLSLLPVGIVVAARKRKERKV